MSVAAEEPTNALKTAALAYAAQGWHVVPLHTIIAGACSCGEPTCPSPGKHPRTRNGLHSATSSHEDVDYFWDEWPDANIGIVAGPSSLAIVDLDSDEAVARWKAMKIGTVTRYAKTGKGLHIYYADPTQAGKPSAGDGIDFRAGPSYVVAPPSIHANGNVYAWQNEDHDIATVPLEVLAHFAKRRTDEARTTDGEIIKEGGRDRALISLAGSARRRGHTETEILALLRITNDERVDPPLDDRDLRRIARSAATYQAGTPELHDAIFWGTETEPATADEPTEAILHSWMPVTIPVDNDPLHPTIGGILFPGLTHELTGDSDTGKTMLLAALAIDQIHDGYSVVWIDFEMGRRHFSKRLLNGLNMDPDEVNNIVNNPETRQLFFINPDQPVGPALLHDLFHVTNDQPVNLLVIDAMIGALTLHGGDSNSDVDVEQIHRELVKPFRERGIAVAIIDHPGKDAEKGTRGSIRKKQAVDVRYTVRATRPYKKGEGGISTLDVKRDRTAELDQDVLRQFHLLPDNAGWRFDTGRPKTEFRPTVYMERVSKYLEAQDEVVSRKTVFSDVEGREEVKRHALQILVAEGFVRDEVGERGARFNSSIHAYRAANDPLSDSYLGTSSDIIPTSSGITSPPHPSSPLSIGDEVRDDHPEHLPEPCPSCSTTMATTPWPTAGGLYCCHDCARGEPCNCKYLETTS